MINSLARGLETLRILARSEGPLGVSDLAARLDVDPSSSYRILATLESYGFVIQEARGRKYSLGFESLAIAGALLRKLDVVSLAGRHLVDLVARTGESAHLAVLSGAKVVFVCRETATALLRVETTVGTAEPAHCTAVGKALLIDHDEHQLRKLFDVEPLPRFTDTTITGLHDLQVELARSRAAGYACDDQELHAGVRCLAAPLRAHDGRIVASIGISGPSARLTSQRLPQLAAAVRDVAGLFSKEMGSPPPLADNQGGDAPLPVRPVGAASGDERSA